MKIKDEEWVLLHKSGNYLSEVRGTQIILTKDMLCARKVPSETRIKKFIKYNGIIDCKRKKIF